MPQKSSHPQHHLQWMHSSSQADKQPLTDLQSQLWEFAQAEVFKSSEENKLINCPKRINFLHVSSFPDLPCLDTCSRWGGLCGCTATANPAYRTEGSETNLKKKTEKKKTTALKPKACKLKWTHWQGWKINNLWSNAAILVSLRSYCQINGT